MKTKNSEVLATFVAYCEAHPHERFWQALRNWSGESFIIASPIPPYEILTKADLRDTFYRVGKT